MPEISVIIPAYNSRKYIRESLDSVLNQTFKDFEIIVVDDGSTDNTKEIINQFYPMSRYIAQKHGGTAKARNTGIKEAKGEFIAFLDADDFWLPTKLEKQIEHFRKHPEVSFVFTENSIFNSKEIVFHTIEKRERLMRGDIIKNIFWRSGLVTPTVMVRKSVFQEVGFFDERLLTAEDDNLWMRIAMKFKIDLIDEPLCHVRVNYESLTNSPDALFMGIRKHLELLTTEYPELKRRLGELLINKKYSGLHFIKGLSYFSRDKFREARVEFEESLKYQKSNFRSLLYWLLSFSPPTFIPILRNWRRKILGLKQNDLR